MRWMKGARALASGLLVLALSCAIPAISAAQDAGTTTDATTTTTTAPEPVTPPADTGGGSQTQPGSQSDGTGKQGGSDKGGSNSAPAPAPAQAEPAAAPSAASDAQPKAHKSASASVTMGDLFFSPSSVTIAVGDTVTWRNTGQAPHNATADDGSFHTPTLNNGQSASHTFTQAGTFSYICTIHPQMKGTIRVLASSSGGGGGGGNGGGASSSSSTGSSGSEASAVASPNAAGDSNTLPMTGMAVGGLALVGLGLLALGLIARQADRERSRLRWFSIF
jgi:plastocyanin